MIYIVTIQDKTLYGEPDVALAVVDAPDEETALRSAHPALDVLAERGRCRCVPHARRLEVGKFYRLGAVIRSPERELRRVRESLPDLPCPRCGNPDTVPLRNYGRPIAGDRPGSSRWHCLECRFRFDGPRVRR